jgi:hypothetical protein
LRTPGEILAHIGDLLEGSVYLMKGEFVRLNSLPLPWNEEAARFLTAAKKFDSYLASDAPLNQPVEKIVQGPVSDVLTHVGQIIMLRRAAGSPIRLKVISPPKLFRVKLGKSFPRQTQDD